MSVYRSLVEDFFLRYERPELDELVVGFSGIDPPKKRASADIDHEGLSGLLGGSVPDGHYHLTHEEWEALRHLLSAPSYDGGFSWTADEEYEAGEEWWLDGGFSDSEHKAGVNGGKAEA